MNEQGIVQHLEVRVDADRAENNSKIYFRAFSRV